MPLLAIQQATLVPGSETPAGDGVTGAQRCIIIVDGEQRLAILKRLPEGELVAELLAALLLSGWGLAVPTPYLVIEQDGLAFASTLEGYPNLKQRLGIDSLPSHMKESAIRAAMLHACQLPSAPLAAA